MTVRRQLLLYPIGAAALLILVGLWSDRAVRRTIESRLAAELQTALDANVTALEIWVNTQTRLASVLADDPEVRRHVMAVATDAKAAPPDGRVEGRRGAPLDPAERALQTVLDDRIRQSGYGAVQVLNTNLVIVGASSRARIRVGTPVESEHAALVWVALTENRPVLITPFKAGFGRAGGGVGRSGRRPPGLGPPGFRQPPPGDGSPRFRPDFNLMEVVAPVRGEDGVVVAALGFILRPEEEFTRVLSVARPGGTGETFAFDPAGRLISASRFDDQLRQIGLLTNAPSSGSPLNVELRDPGLDLTRTGARLPTDLATRPLMAMVRSAVAGTNGVTMIPERDYRGVPVVGAWRWLEEHHFGVATKVDATEAFQPLRVLRSVFVVLLLLLALVTLVMLASSYGQLVWRRRFDEAQLTARKLGQYTLAGKLGEGGMGVVYRAHHALLRRETAIKLLLPDRADEDLVRQFEHEVQLTCGLSHPNTIQIYDYGHTADGIFYYAMELLEGLTLQELVERHGPQPEERVIHLMVQVCGSLAEAHAAGLIHRDIKPGNLFLCERGREPDTVKVLDFGLVRRFGTGTGGAKEGDVTGGGARFVGTPLYMAPETIRRADAGDPRSDLYALGAVAYVLLTGHPVFGGDGFEAIWEQHRSAVPVPPRERMDGRPISRELEALVLACLEKNPRHRPQSAGELAEALTACPEAEAWTPERRREWWNRWMAGMDVPATPGAATPATVKIDLSERTGA